VRELNVNSDTLDPSSHQIIHIFITIQSIIMICLCGFSSGGAHSGTWLKPCFYRLLTGFAASFSCPKVLSSHFLSCGCISGC
jgi:hypothetical protein